MKRYLGKYAEYFYDDKLSLVADYILKLHADNSANLEEPEEPTYGDELGEPETCSTSLASLLAGLEL